MTHEGKGHYGDKARKAAIRLALALTIPQRQDRDIPNHKNVDD